MKGIEERLDKVRTEIIGIEMAVLGMGESGEYDEDYIDDILEQLGYALDGIHGANALI